jgi:chemotaxis signal transduction protein
MTSLKWITGEVSSWDAKLLLERAEALRAGSDQEEDKEGQGQEVAVFELGKGRWALPLKSLLVCEKLQGVTPVPLSKNHTLGVRRFRGKVITVFSLGTLLGVQGWRRDSSILLVLRAPGGQLFAVDCESVPQNLQISDAAVNRARQQVDEHSLYLPITLDDRSMVNLIDFGRLTDFIKTR